MVAVVAAEGLRAVRAREGAALLQRRVQPPRRQLRAGAEEAARLRRMRASPSWSIAIHPMRLRLVRQRAEDGAVSAEALRRPALNIVFQSKRVSI